MIFIKIITDIICAALNSLGGHGFLWMRRYVMPVIIGVSLSIIIHIWWVGLMVLPVMGTLCLGYFGKGFWGRGSWLALQALIIGLGLFLTNHLSWYFYIPYVLVSLLLGGFLYDLEQIIGDIIFGVGLSSIVFLVR